MKLRQIILLAGMALWLGSCNYTENDIYFVEPVAGDPPVFSVITSLDTIVAPEVTDSMEVRYEVSIENGEFYLMQAYVGNVLLINSDSTENNFWIYADDVPYPGLDTLYMDFYYSTNSNSLADLIKAEANVRHRAFGINFKEGALP
jgi:hypothetical protein